MTQETTKATLYAALKRAEMYVMHQNSAVWDQAEQDESVRIVRAALALAEKGEK